MMALDEFAIEEGRRRGLPSTRTITMGLLSEDKLLSR